MATKIWMVGYLLISLSSAFLIINPEFINGFNYPIFETIALARQGNNHLLDDPFIAASLDWNSYQLFISVLTILDVDNWKYFYAFWYSMSVIILASATYLISDIFLKKQYGPNVNISARRHSFLTTAVSLLSLIFIFSTHYFRPFGYGTIIPGDNAIVYNFAQPQMVATSLSFLLLGLDLSWHPKSRYAKSLIFTLIIAVIWLIHLHMAILISGIYFVLSMTKKDIKAPLVTIITAFVLCLPAYYQVILNQLDTASISYVESSGYVRHPHHLIPSLMRPYTWLLFTAFAGLLLLARYFATNSLRQSTDFIFWVVTPGLLILGTVFVEIIPIDFIAKLQLFRVTLYFKYFGVIFIITVISSMVIERLNQHFKFSISKNIEKLALLSLLVLSLAALVNDFFSLRDIKRTPLEYVEWIKNNTQQSDRILVLTLPAAIIQFSERPIYWDSKRYPFNTTHGSAWVERFCAYTQINCSAYEGSEFYRLKKDGLKKVRRYDKMEWHKVMKSLKISTLVIPSHWLTKKDYTWTAGSIGILHFKKE